MLNWVAPIVVPVAIIYLGVMYVRSWFRRMASTPPASAWPKTKPICPQPQKAPSDNIVYQMAPTDSAGIVQHTEIVLDARVTVNVTGDLVIVANNQITINGTIRMPPGTATWDGITPPPNVTLICEDGPIIVNGAVGQSENDAGDLGQDVSDTGAYAIAIGKAAQPGGTISLLADTIIINGKVNGHSGGWGGNGDAVGVAGFFGVNGGYAGAVGAQSGWGGDVLLCAMEQITIAGAVQGGWAGRGGHAVANAANGADAYARSGPGNVGGDVYITGLGSPLVVNLTGTIDGGRGGSGGQATANGGTGAWSPSNGGDALAAAGDAGDGGSVIFMNASPSGPGVARAGAGADGGLAEATGGDGAAGQNWALLIGRPGDGGSAQAQGGNGGRDGAQGGPATHAPGWAQMGGNATATAGDGGRAGATAGGSGGESGTAIAQGGNGTTGSPARAGPLGPVAPTGGVGGVGPVASSPGAP